MQAWIEAETKPRAYTLYESEEVPQNLSGASVELVLTGNDGITIPTPGAITPLDAPAGRVRYTPGPGHLLAARSPYSAVFKVTGADASVGFFPSDGADEWHVYPPHTTAPRLTFQDLRIQVLRWLDAFEELDTGSTLDRLVRLQLTDSAIARASEYPWPFMKSTYRLPVEPGTLRYSLPGNLGRLLYVWSPQGRQYATLVPDRHFMDLSIQPDGAPGGAVWMPYELQGNILVFLEQPAAAETLIVQFFRTPAKLLHPADLPNLPYPHSRLLVWDALLDLKSYAQDLSGAPLWIAKRDQAVHDLYQAFKSGQALGEVPQFIHPGRA
jgi:hypothetical protein